VGPFFVALLLTAAPAHRLMILVQEDRDVRAADLKRKFGDAVQHVEVDEAGQFRLDFKEGSAPDRELLRLKTPWKRDATGLGDESCDPDRPIPLCVHWYTAYGRIGATSELRFSALRPAREPPFGKALGLPYVETRTTQQVRFAGITTPCSPNDLDCYVGAKRNYEPVGPATVETSQKRATRDTIVGLADVRAECGKRWIDLHPVYDFYLVGAPAPDAPAGEEATVVSVRRSGTLPLIDADTGKDVRPVNPPWVDAPSADSLLRRCGF
jgi:hypothetical protein